MAEITSNYLRQKMLDHVLRNTAFTPPATVYLALFSEDAATAGLIAGALTSELAGGSYVRQAIYFAAAGATGLITTNAAVEFPVATADWGQIKSWAIMDAPNSGNVLYCGDFNEVSPGVWKAAFTGDSFLVRSGDLSIQER